MKRLLSVLIILSMLLSFSACKPSKNDDTTGNQDSGGNPTTDDTSTDDTPINVNGVKITEYNIVCDTDGLDYNMRAAEYIRDSIYSATGCKLSIVDDSEAAKDREIVVGETARPISQELNTDTVGFQFAMLANGGSVALEADYFVIAAAAYYFVDTYVSGSDTTIPDGLTVRTPVTKEAKNYILLIGDGMGVYQTMLYDYLTDTSDYSDGEDYFYGYMFPYLGLARTSSFTGVTDSAAAGTALATGYKTNNKYIGVDKDGNERKSLTELAAELGKATAVMSTETNSGATPSTFSAHELHRDNKSEIMADQAALTQQYGTIIECGFDYYTAKYMKSSVEKRITETLTALDKDEDGFFLMYEEAHIDKHCANNDMEKAFLALIRFNQAIARFMEYAFYNPDTVVIITADHETGGLSPSQFDGNLYFLTEDHTSADVPVFAWGHGTEIFNEKAVENIEIAQFFASSMGVNDFGDKSGDWYNEIYPGGGTHLPIIPVQS